MDSTAPKLLRPVLNAQVRAHFAITNKRDKMYSKAFSKLRNSAAQVAHHLLHNSARPPVHSTSVPDYQDSKVAWPARPGKPWREQIMHDIENTKVSDDLNSSLDGFHTLGEGAFYHLSDNSHVERLAAAVGLPDATNMVNFLFGGRNMINGRPSLPGNFGKLLHSVPEQQALHHLITIACCGAYQGHFGWKRLSVALVEGAWPWLRRYTKAYAKAMPQYNSPRFSRAVNHSTSIYQPSTRMSRPKSPLRQRRPQILHPHVAQHNAPPSHYHQQQHPHQQHQHQHQPQQSSYRAIPLGPIVPSWTHVPPSFSQPTLDASFPSHTIIPGPPCNHGPSASHACHVRVAHSLADVQRYTADGKGLTVALTGLDAQAQEEVETWARRMGLLSVKRAEEMCAGCAVRLGWVIGAMLVYG
ncbi:hypothetical protein QBC34DRAFT_385911 [Podospora aff. communis PSN243]|uniref:Uncharacterized protein n=1 Tax=Podospora aff. communis PSN243 TaxID=3040156 RepID=A0AAV9G716_9PEZI|nr:hypothetical protein QBC34DRAFT_385911 [Podospora aff. communis PSN243]